MSVALCIAMTTHIALGDGWRENHPCIKYEHGDYTVGTFINSEDAVSVYASRTWGRDGWFIEAGAVTGYSGGDVLPMVRAGYEFGDARAFVVPAYDIRSESVGVVFGLEVSTQLFGD